MRDLQVVERMYGCCFKAGSVVLQQGALPKPDDCMYFLQLGEAEVVISGAVDQASKGGQGNEERMVEGHTVRIPQKPGWVFGDVALLFHSARTASVMAKTNITVWALDRKTFLQFVMKHAQGARALRFLRKLPLLKGGWPGAELRWGRLLPATALTRPSLSATRGLSPPPQVCRTPT